MHVRLSHTVNHLLASLSGGQRDRFLAECTSVQLVFGDVLYEHGAVINYVYFPQTGFISLLSAVDGHKAVETTIIGCEGMLGATLVLGVNTAPVQSLVQGKGRALRMTTEQFLQHLRGSAELRLTVNRYLFVLVEQLALNTACIRFHEVRARLARWLLMTEDRAHGQPLHFTHQFLAKMLGVRRSAVTIAAGDLQQRDCIHYSRGQIRVISRIDLEAMSCGCYAASAEAYDQQFPSCNPLRQAM